MNETVERLVYLLLVVGCAVLLACVIEITSLRNRVEVLEAEATAQIEVVIRRENDAEIIPIPLDWDN